MEQPYETNKQLPAVGGMGAAGANIVASGGTLVGTQTQYQQAVTVQKPRDLAKMDQVLQLEAKESGRAFYYTWMVYDKIQKKKVPILGGSIGLAMAMYREYGNCTMDLQLRETPAASYFTVTIIDLEKGACFPRIFKGPADAETGGKYKAGRQEIMRFQKAQSQGIRNAILAMMPRGMTDRYMRIAIESEKAVIQDEGVAEAAAKCIEAFSSRWHVSLPALEEYVDRKAETWRDDDIITLRGIYQALKDGQDTVEDIFKRTTFDKEAAAASTKTAEELMAATTKAKPASKPAPAADPPKAAPATQAENLATAREAVQGINKVIKAAVDIEEQPAAAGKSSGASREEMGTCERCGNTAPFGFMEVRQDQTGRALCCPDCVLVIDDDGAQVIRQQRQAPAPEPVQPARPALQAGDDFIPQFDGDTPAVNGEREQPAQTTMVQEDPATRSGTTNAGLAAELRSEWPIYDGVNGSGPGPAPADPSPMENGLDDKKLNTLRAQAVKLRIMEEVNSEMFDNFLLQRAGHKNIGKAKKSALVAVIRYFTRRLQAAGVQI